MISIEHFEEIAIHVDWVICQYQYISLFCGCKQTFSEQTLVYSDGRVVFSYHSSAHLCFIVYLHPTVPRTQSSITIRPCIIYLSHDRPLWALMESYSHGSEPGLCLIASVSVHDALLLEWDESQQILPGHY